jgi:Zn-dependent protease with chaperone function
MKKNPNPNLYESELNQASNAYLLTLMAVMVGLPLPVLNLIACIGFYFLLRPKSQFTKFHVLQAITSQVPIIIMNSTGLFWTLGVFFKGFNVSNLYISYIITIAVFNVVDIVYNIIAAIKARKGYLYSYSFFGPLSALIVNEELVERARQRVSIDFAILVISFGTLWGGLSMIPFMKESKPFTLNRQHEEKLGELLIESYLLGEQECRDADKKYLVDKLVEKLSVHLDSSQYTYRIKLVETKEVNAYSFPGGYIVINTGLIDFCQSSKELAAVIAHEMGHNEHHHVVKSIARDIGLAMLLSTVGSDSNQLRELMSRLISNQFSRDQEADADAFAVDLLLKAGIDPEPMAQFFERMLESRPEFMEELEFLATHPADGKRVQQIRALSKGKVIEDNDTDEEWMRLDELMGKSKNGN